MKKLNVFLALLLIGAMLSSCALLGGTDGGEDGGSKIEASTLPADAFTVPERAAVIGSIVQTGDGNAYVNGTVPAATRMRFLSADRTDYENTKHLVTLVHAFNKTCYVSGYIGNDLYIIQDFGSLMLNKKGIGHKDGTVLLPYGENGYFSISSFSEDKVIVGNPSADAVDLLDQTDSYVFGYMTYDKETRTLRPLYEENNLRFHTAGYFMDGVAIVSTKEGDKILFGIIDAEGNYVVEPTYEMMGDESVNDLLVVGITAEPATDEYSFYDACGKHIIHDETLMTAVQGTRYYESKSQTVGIINKLTGDYVLPCEYAYVERVTGDTYFVIDNEGAKFLYNAATDTRTAVENGSYIYLNSNWMLYLDDVNSAYFANSNFELFETEGVAVELDTLIGDARFRIRERVNTNLVAAVRDEATRVALAGGRTKTGIESTYDPDARVYTITVTATGDTLTVKSFTYPYNGSFLYTVENSLYRYDMETRESTRIETGYGDYTADYENKGESYYADVSELDEGVFVLRYNIKMEFGVGYYMLLINDKGTILFDTDMNSVDQLTKNYLGKYDDALYELAGITEIEDNYLLTRSDGEHFLLQFVRGEESVEGITETVDLSNTRRIDSLQTFSLLSPFALDLVGDEITVKLGDEFISADCYVYDADAHTLKLLGNFFDGHFELFDVLEDDGFFEVTVTIGEESTVLRIELSPLALWF